MLKVHAQSREELQASLKAGLGEGLVLTDAAEMVRYCRDWHGDVSSSAVAVIRPRNVEDVAATVRLCAELGLAIVPQGGNTGLVGGGDGRRAQHDAGRSRRAEPQGRPAGQLR